eukprot:6127551-Pyramimonas_sp.AAC.1
MPFVRRNVVATDALGAHRNIAAAMYFAQRVVTIFSRPPTARMPRGERIIISCCQSEGNQRV